MLYQVYFMSRHLRKTREEPRGFYEIFAVPMNDAPVIEADDPSAAFLQAAEQHSDLRSHIAVGEKK
jgi:hypothetical protein